MRPATHAAFAAIAAAAGLAFVSTAALAESSSSAGVATAGNGSTSVAIGSAPVGSTVVVNGKHCKVVSGDDNRHMSGSVTTTGNGSSSVSIGTGNGASGMVMSSNADGTTNCMVIKPKASADDDRGRDHDRH